MAKKSKILVARNVSQLARILNLDAQAEIQMEFRAQLNFKIIEIVKKKSLTHSQVAEKSKASRTRVTAILNGNTSGISTDLMIRVLCSLGYRIEARFAPYRNAA